MLDGTKVDLEEVKQKAWVEETGGWRVGGEQVGPSHAVVGSQSFMPSASF